HHRARRAQVVSPLFPPLPSAERAGVRGRQLFSPPHFPSPRPSPRRGEGDELIRSPMSRVWLSLGSNLEPERHLRAALAALRARCGTVAASPAYRFPAVGFEGPDVINLAAGIETDLEPAALDAWRHALEDRHGRRRDVPRYSS